MFGKSIEIAFETGHRILIRSIIINSETAAYIHYGNQSAGFLHPCKHFGRLVTKHLERLIVENLRPYMEMHTAQINIAHSQCAPYKFVKQLHTYAEFVFLQARGDIMMGMRVDIRIHTDCDMRHTVHPRGYRIDVLQFGQRLDIEAPYIIFQCQFYLSIGFAHTGKHNGIARETGSQSRLDFTPAHAIHTESVFPDSFQYLRIVIGLYGIMHMKAMLAGKLRNGLQCAPQQIHIVIIERRFQFPEFFYREICHIIYMF